jgi:succinate dehydrogenase hydrophobic anchor subunit
MHLRLVDYVLWLATPVLQTGLLVALYRRGLHRDYPCFFNYTILQILSDPVLALCSRFSYSAYYYGYYVNLGLSVIISFAVLQEVFKDAFRPYENLRDLSVILFRWSALVVLLVAVMWAINSAHPAADGIVNDAMQLAARSVRLMQCGLVFFLLLFHGYLGISPRSMLFGISIGFGFFAAINMLVFTGLSRHGLMTDAMLSRINGVAYAAAVVLWLGYTLAAAPSRSKAYSEAVMRSPDWNSALKEARVVPADSLLDTMDRTVERLLYPPEQAKMKVAGDAHLRSFTD